MTALDNFVLQVLIDREAELRQECARLRLMAHEAIHALAAITSELAREKAARMRLLEEYRALAEGPN